MIYGSALLRIVWWLPLRSRPVYRAAAGQDERDRDGHSGGEEAERGDGDTAVERIPAMALAARLAPAWIVVSRPNAEHGSKIATQTGTPTP